MAAMPTGSILQALACDYTELRLRLWRAEMLVVKAAEQDYTLSKTDWNELFALVHKRPVAHRLQSGRKPKGLQRPARTAG